MIDNILTNNLFDISLKKGIIESNISDHFPIFVAFNTSKTKNLPRKVIFKKRIINKAKIAVFKEHLPLVNWRCINYHENVNDTYETFLKTFSDIYDSYFPIEELSVKQKDLQTPWMSRALKQISKQKQKLYIRYIKLKTNDAEKSYKDYKSLFEKFKKKAKNNYYISLLSQHQGNSKRTWQIMKEITGKVKTNGNSLPKMLKTENGDLYNKKEIASEFNNFFTAVGPKLASKILSGSLSFESFLTPIDQHIVHSDLSFEEFETAFRSLKRNKANGVDNINNNIVLDVYDEIKNVLYFIFKSSLQQGIFQNQLKTARVTSVFKAGDQTNVSNYRPISVLPVFSKVLERIMYNKVHNYLLSNNLLFDKQFGFQINNSTEHAILQLVRDITNSFNNREYTLGVFMICKKLLILLIMIFY